MTWRDEQLRRTVRGAGAAAIVDPDGFAEALGKKLADVEGRGHLVGSLVAGWSVVGACALNGGHVGPLLGFGIMAGAAVVRLAGIVMRRMIP